ncbi:hypothetical protein HDU96_010556 [Phlyctochytrium bullatum]|nr:hypothetical protein HDU96_010556 [Phlyctochytrium bullatum]
MEDLHGEAGSLPNTLHTPQQMYQDTGTGRPTAGESAPGLPHQERGLDLQQLTPTTAERARQAMADLPRSPYVDPQRLARIHELFRQSEQARTRSSFGLSGNPRVEMLGSTSSPLAPTLAGSSPVGVRSGHLPSSGDTASLPPENAVENGIPDTLAASPATGRENAQTANFHDGLPWIPVPDAPVPFLFVGLSRLAEAYRRQHPNASIDHVYSMSLSQLLPIVPSAIPGGIEFKTATRTGRTEDGSAGLRLWVAHLPQLCREQGIPHALTGPRLLAFKIFFVPKAWGRGDIYELLVKAKIYSLVEDPFTMTLHADGKTGWTTVLFESSIPIDCVPADVVSVLAKGYIPGRAGDVRAFAYGHDTVASLLQRHRARLAVVRSLALFDPHILRLPAQPRRSINTAATEVGAVGTLWIEDGDLRRPQSYARAFAFREEGWPRTTVEAMGRRLAAFDCEVLSFADVANWRDDICALCDAFGHGAARCPQPNTQEMWHRRMLSAMHDPLREHLLTDSERGTLRSWLLRNLSGGLPVTQHPAGSPEELAIVSQVCPRLSAPPTSSQKREWRALLARLNAASGGEPLQQTPSAPSKGGSAPTAAPLIGKEVTLAGAGLPASGHQPVSGTERAVAAYLRDFFAVDFDTVKTMMATTSTQLRREGLETRVELTRAVAAQGTALQHAVESARAEASAQHAELRAENRALSDRLAAIEGLLLQRLMDAEVTYPGTARLGEGLRLDTQGGGAFVRPPTLDDSDTEVTDLSPVFEAANPITAPGGAQEDHVGLPLGDPVMGSAPVPVLRTPHTPPHSARLATADAVHGGREPVVPAAPAKRKAPPRAATEPLPVPLPERRAAAVSASLKFPAQLGALRSTARPPSAGAGQEE